VTHHTPVVSLAWKSSQPTELFWKLFRSLWCVRILCELLLQRRSNTTPRALVAFPPRRSRSQFKTHAAFHKNASFNHNVGSLPVSATFRVVSLDVLRLCFFCVARNTHCCHVADVIFPSVHQGNGVVHLVRAIKQRFAHRASPFLACCHYFFLWFCHRPPHLSYPGYTLRIRTQCQTRTFCVQWRRVMLPSTTSSS